MQPNQFEQPDHRPRQQSDHTPRTEPANASALSAWWRQPDHFDWFTTYLHRRRMASMTRVVLVVISLSLAWIPIGMCFSSSPPKGALHTTFAVLAGAGGTAAACLWAARFPTRKQSIGFAFLSSVSIALAALAQSDPLIGILACTAFAPISGYIALFHTAVLMTANLVVVLGVSAVPTLALAATDGVVTAMCACGVTLVVNIGVAYGVQVIVHVLGGDVLRADRDHLTGLFHRRAFYQRTTSLIANQRGNAHLVMAMIDLDGFKQINDTHGHRQGDLALAAVGRTLRERTQPRAVLGRAGGEEFLVADVLTDPRPHQFGQHLCDAIAALPHAITASVGIVHIPCEQIRSAPDADAVITELIGAADAAMYVAKRNGGNQIRYHDAPPVTLGGH